MVKPVRISLYLFITVLGVLLATMLTPQIRFGQAIAADSDSVTYKVRRGDSVNLIASFYSISPQALIAANNLEAPYILYKGQQLTIPSEPDVMAGAESPAAVTQPEAEVTETPTMEGTATATEEPTAEAETETADLTPTPEAESAMEATATPTEEPTPEATETPTAEGTATPAEEMVEDEAEAADLTPTSEPESEMEATATPTEEPIAEDEPEDDMSGATPTPEPEGEEEGETAADIIDTAADAGDFTTLLAALDAAGITGALKGDGPFTLFAPTDDAFAALPAGTLDALLADPTGDLTQILLYHVVPGQILRADITDGLEAETIQGGFITFSVDDTFIMVDNANVVAADIETANGVIHVIDAVLLPPQLASGAEESRPAEDASAAQMAQSLPDASFQPDRISAWMAPIASLAVFSPVADGAYHSPIAINGLAGPQTEAVTVELRNGSGDVIAERSPFGDDENLLFFATYIRFEVTEVGPATIHIYGQNAEEGVMGETEIPLTTLPGQRLIDIIQPQTGETICGQVPVAGYSNTFEANVVLELRQHNDEEVGELFAMGGNLGMYRDFARTFNFVPLTPQPFLVSAMATDASGRFFHIDKTVVPVTVLPPSNSEACIR